MKPSTCALDPFPTALNKSKRCAVSPLITKVINHSLQTGHVPPELKTAVIRPHLKKTTLDPEVLSSYRPISNLPVISTVLEKAVAAQLQTKQLVWEIAVWFPLWPQHRNRVTFLVCHLYFLFLTSLCSFVSWFLGFLYWLTQSTSRPIRLELPL